VQDILDNAEAGRSAEQIATEIYDLPLDAGRRVLCFARGRRRGQRFVTYVELANPWAAITEPLPESLSKTLPVALSRAEVLHFLGSVEDIEHQAILTTCYAAGLRISEAVRLKTSSLDNQRMVIRAAPGSLIVEPSAHYLAL
jgi:integrase